VIPETRAWQLCHPTYHTTSGDFLGFRDTKTPTFFGTAQQAIDFFKLCGHCAPVLRGV
jgi:hypothetical protein